MSDVLVLNADGSPLSLLPISVVSWQTAIRLLTLGKVNVIKEYDNWVVRSPSVHMKVPSVVVTTNYIKWNRHVKYNRSNVYLRDNFTCQYCKSPFHPGNLTIDHVLPKSHGGLTCWSNVATACKDCNSNKGNDKSILPAKKPYKPSYYELASKRRRYPISIKDEYWLNYLKWPEELINYVPHEKSKTNGEINE